MAVIDVPPDGVGAVQRYEERVLPLLARHGGRLDRRLATRDGTTEVHVLSFAAESGYRNYLVDPDRTSHRRMLTGLDLAQRVVESLVDVDRTGRTGPTR